MTQCRLFHIPLVAGLLTAFTSLPVRAAYNLPVAWSDGDAIDLNKAFAEIDTSSGNVFDFVATPAMTKRVIQDSDKRISSDFDVPKEMDTAFRFWLDVYTQYTTYHRVIFDRHHPEVIYEVVDLRDIQKTARNRVVYEILAERRMKKVMAEYRAAFARLSKKSVQHRKRKISATAETPAALYEQRILRALANTSHRHTFAEFATTLGSQTGQRDNVINGLSAAETFFPHMDRIFVDMGLPPELTRLSLVESSFNLKAVSKAGASGVWQFMERSAKEFMTLDEAHGIDERRSPLKSTVAAAKLLRRNKAVLGNWMLAIVSYNHGLRSFLKFPKEKRTSKEFLAIFKPCNKNSPLGWASRNYYPEFLAMLYAESYRDIYYGDAVAPVIRHVNYETVRKSQSGFALALERGIPIQEFRYYNPDILDLRKPLPTGFTVALPGDQQTDFVKLIRRKARRVI